MVGTAVSSPDLFRPREGHRITAADVPSTLKFMSACEQQNGRRGRWVFSFFVCDKIFPGGLALMDTVPPWPRKLLQNPCSWRALHAHTSPRAAPPPPSTTSTTSTTTRHPSPTATVFPTPTTLHLTARMHDATVSRRLLGRESGRLVSAATPNRPHAQTRLGSGDEMRGPCRSLSIALQAP